MESINKTFNDTFFENKIILINFVFFHYFFAIKRKIIQKTYLIDDNNEMK